MEKYSITDIRHVQLVSGLCVDGECVSKVRHTSWLVRYSLYEFFCNENLPFRRRFSADIASDDGSLQKTTYDGLVVDYLISDACTFGDFRIANPINLCRR